MKYNSKYKPVPKKFVKRFTLYGSLCKSLDTGRVQDYDHFVSKLGNCGSKEELKDLITNAMRDYLMKR